MSLVCGKAPPDPGPESGPPATACAPSPRTLNYSRPGLEVCAPGANSRRLVERNTGSPRGAVGVRSSWKSSWQLRSMRQVFTSTPSHFQVLPTQHLIVRVLPVVDQGERVSVQASPMVAERLWHSPVGCFYEVGPALAGKVVVPSSIARRSFLRSLVRCERPIYGGWRTLATVARRSASTCHCVCRIVSSARYSGGRHIVARSAGGGAACMPRSGVFWNCVGGRHNMHRFLAPSVSHICAPGRMCAGAQEPRGRSFSPPSWNACGCVVECWRQWVVESFPEASRTEGASLCICVCV